jgi:hypothetical protein
MDGLRKSLAPYISNRVVGWPAVKGHESASRTARSAPLTAGRAPTRTIFCRERGNQRGPPIKVQRAVRLSEFGRRHVDPSQPSRQRESAWTATWCALE